MPRPGLRPVKRTIHAKGKVFTRTYWVRAQKPAKPSAAQRLVAAQRGEEGQGTLPAHVKPPAFHASNAMKLKPGRNNPATTHSAHQDMVRDEQETFLAVAKGLNSALGGHGQGVAAVMSHDDDMLFSSQPDYVEAYYTTPARVVVLRNKQPKALHEAALKGKITTGAEVEALNSVTHEFLHGASNDHAYGGAGNQPHAALEEATTELLARHYAPAVAKAMAIPLDASIPAPTPIHSLKIRGEEDVFATGVAYSAYCTQFGRLTLLSEGHTGKSLSSEDLQRLVFAKAAAVKKAAHGARYGILRDGILKQAGIVPGVRDKLKGDARERYDDAFFTLSTKVTGILEQAMLKPVLSHSMSVIRRDLSAVTQPFYEEHVKPTLASTTTKKYKSRGKTRGGRSRSLKKRL